MERFDLARLPLEERAAALAEIAGKTAVPFVASTLQKRRTLEFVHGWRDIGAVIVTSTYSSNLQGWRTAVQARDDSEPRVGVVIPRGDFRMEHNGRQVLARKGSIVPFWDQSEFLFQIDAASENFSTTMPVAMLGLPYLLTRDVLGADLGRSPLAPLVRQYLLGLTELPDLTAEQSDALIQPTIDLLRALLTTAHGDEARSRGPLSRTLGIRVLQHIRASMSDPDLNADSLAARFGISKRYLYVVLKQHDISLRRERMRRAAQLLGTAAGPAVAVGAVARLCGFAEHSSFSRAFKDHYGCTPSEWRLLSDADRAARDF